MEVTKVAPLNCSLFFFFKSHKNDHVLFVHIEDVLDFLNKMVKSHSLVPQLIIANKMNFCYI